MADGKLNDQYMEELRKRGFRLTNQRETIIKVLMENSEKHCSISDLWELAREKDPSIGIATIYRTVNLLSDLGLLNLINGEEGFYRFELPDERMHFHIFCKVCGKLIQMKDEAGKEQELHHWIEEEGFHFIPQTLKLPALCDECYKRLSEGKDLPPTTCRGMGGRGRRRRGWCR
jgi:Fur family ferric uptake transcriptional regulator